MKYSINLFRLAVVVGVRDTDDGGRTMELKEFANLIDGRQYDYRMFTKEELQLAKDNRIVIVTGASDDLVELEGAITDEGDCWEGGKIYVKAIPNGGIVHNCERSDVFGFTAKWCEEKDKNGKIISWTYDVPIEHDIMTKEQIHEALCKAPDEDKMRLAIACQMNGIDVRDIETGLANVLTGIQKAIKPAIEYYRYLGGK